MHKTILAFALFSLALIFAVASCKKDSNNPDYAANADCTAIVTADNTYTNSIKAILNTGCASAGCHDAISVSSGVDLSNYANSKNVFQNNNALCAIHHGSGCKPMPNGSPKLSDATINKLDCWAKNGYAE
ncbi:MAG: hypothetical protein K9J37_02540 [Saprospiraceae bacterium]|nr:hypothetical protein [Saprospiraceae bacterium]MCF8248758.1 hypothetical protein [Saprospiraceae bacterium]MCF8278752.1 hypothetical protein [Bacteroidales bacterium]MCF8310552.1 hypothetical protein [Saprospiraceae bacterium]MCF8439111.1 hypothetical protein [Saprospiraceae bacterium]